MNDSSYFKPNNMDVFLAIISSIIMPLLCSILYEFTGALIPMLVYYVIFCIMIVKWRRGSLDYHIPKDWAIKYFFVSFGIIILRQVIVAFIVIPYNAPVIEIALTVIFWSTINAFMEQLIWIYVYDVFTLRFDQPPKKYVGMVIGFIFCLILVGMIHALFWSKFLMHFSKVFPFYQMQMPMSFVTLIIYILIYKKTGSLFQVFLLHLFTDIMAVVLTGYSIIPYLIR